MPWKLTNKIFDERIANRKIKRLGDYVHSDSPIKLQCLVENCGYVWDSTPRYIFNEKRGCPQCKVNAPLTDEKIDTKLSENNRPIKRLGNYINNRVHIDWLCLVEGCGYIWPATTKGIFTKGSGCPKCAGHAPVTNEDIDLKLLQNNRNIKRLTDCNRSMARVDWMCLIEGCGHIWNAFQNNVINHGKGCPKCARNARLTNEDIDNTLLKYNRNIRRLGEYINVSTHIEWLCLAENCGYIWPARPNGVINKGTGCPACNSMGISENLILKLLKLADINFVSQFKIREIDKHAPAYEIDAFFDEIKLAVEYNGEQHYDAVCFGGSSLEEAQTKFEKQLRRDQYIRDFCQAHNIELIEIDGRKYKSHKLTKYLNDELIPYIKSKLSPKAA